MLLSIASDSTCLQPENEDRKGLPLLLKQLTHHISLLFAPPLRSAQLAHIIQRQHRRQYLIPLPLLEHVKGDVLAGQ